MRKKTMSRAWRLRFGKTRISFRLPLNEPMMLSLWSEYLEKRKNQIKPAFVEVTALAREQQNDKSHTKTFVDRMISKCKSDQPKDQKGAIQKAVIEIFRLALERYSFYQKQGRAPILSDREKSIREEYSDYCKKWKIEKRP